MTPVGHVAFAYLVADARTSDWRAPYVAAIGALIPDIVDKGLWVFGIYPWGRTIGHSFIVWGLLVAILVLATTSIRPFPALYWLSVGGVSHLFADLADDFADSFQWSGQAFAAWPGWPFTNPDIWVWHVTPIAPDFSPITTFEVVVVVVAIAIVWRRVRADGGG